jgi:lipopolysaccharide export system protein LptC
MIQAKQTLWIVLTLLLLIGSSWYYQQLKPHVRLDSDTLATSIDSTILNLTVKQFNEQGKLANLLVTPLMEHIPKDNINLIQQPHIVINEENQAAWEINSRSAKSYFGGEHITFIDKVTVHQNPDKNNQESTLRTEEVTYFPKEKRATTDRFVTFEQPGNFIESTGMNAYLEEKRVELLHGAKGSYAPSQKG